MGGAAVAIAPTHLKLAAQPLEKCYALFIVPNSFCTPSPVMLLELVARV